MADYTPPTWTDGSTFTSAQATAIAAELEEQENYDTTQDAASGRWSRLSDRHAGDVKRRTWWRNKANTSTIPGEDTGLTIAMSGADMASARILDGRLTIDATTAGAKAFYRHFTETGPVTRIGGRFNFLKGARTTKGGAVNCTVSNKVLNTGDTTLRFGIHWLSTPDYWLVQKYNNATSVFTDLAGGPVNGAYVTPLAEDGRTYEIDIVRIGSNTALLFLPDGRTATVTDSDVDTWCGNFGFHEIYMAAGNTDSLPGWTETWADTATYYGDNDQMLTREMLGQHTGQLAYAETASTATFTTALADYAGLSITVPKCDKPVTLEADLGLVSDGSGGYHQLSITNAANTVVQSVLVTTVAGALPDAPAPTLRCVIPANTAATTYKVRIGAQTAGGTCNAQPGTLGYVHKAFIRASF